MHIIFETATCGPKSLIATSETQILKSPNYPLPYDNNLLCSWTIELEDLGSITLLNFTDLDLADNKDCRSDYLEVQYEQVKLINSQNNKIY